MKCLPIKSRTWKPWKPSAAARTWVKEAVRSQKPGAPASLSASRFQPSRKHSHHAEGSCFLASNMASANLGTSSTVQQILPRLAVYCFLSLCSSCSDIIWALGLSTRLMSKTKIMNNLEPWMFWLLVLRRLLCNSRYWAQDLDSHISCHINLGSRTSPDLHNRTSVWELAWK